MPIYEYRCRQCDHRFEVLQRLGAGADEVLCPSCSAEQPEKLLSTFSAGATQGGGETSRAASGGSAGGCGVSCGCRH